MYGSGWKDTLRDTPCLNLIPVNSKNTKDPKLHKIWSNGVDWSIELIKLHLTPQFIILYGNDRSKNAKSVWREFEKELHLIDCCPRIDVTKTFKIHSGVVSKGKLKGVPVLGLPHLSYMNGNILETLCNKLSEMAKLRPFP